MKRIITKTGLVKVIHHDQQWFEFPGQEVIFTRIHIEQSYGPTAFRESSSDPERNDSSEHGKDRRHR